MRPVAYLSTAILGTLLTIAPATAQSTPSPFAGSAQRATNGNSGPVDNTEFHLRGFPESQRVGWVSAGQEVQIARWQAVGRCVVAGDRDASLTLATAPRSSAASRAAARRLDPLFDQCAQGVKIDNRGTTWMRRLAVADVLGVPASR